MFAMGPAFFKQSATGYATLALSGTFAAATAGVAYSSSLSISGGLAPYSLTGGTGIASGSLPDGLSLSIAGSALVLSGTPTTAATSTPTVSVTSTDSQTATSAQSIIVSANAIDAWFDGGGAGLWLDAAQGAWRDAAGTTGSVTGDPVRLWKHRRGARDVASSGDSTSAVLRWDATLSRYYLEFTAASLQQYIVNSGVKGDWKALHDGSEFVIVAKVSFGKSANPLALLPLISTSAISNSQIGFDLFYDDRSSFSDTLRAYVTSGTGANGVMDLQSNNAVTPQTIHTVSVANLNTTGATPDLFAYVDGALKGSYPANSYSPGDPQDMLTIGGSHGSFYADMKLYGLAILIGSGVTANRAAYEAAI